MKLFLNVNILYSAVSMAANLLLPLAAVPFLIKNLGIDTFGEFAVAQAAAMIVCQVVDFGFSLSGAREVAGEAGYKEIDAIYSKYQNARLFLAFIALLLVLILLPIGIIPADNVLLIVTICSCVFGVFLQANWFFLGRALFGWLAFANLTGKLVYLLAVILFIKHPDDVNVAGFAFGLGYLVSGFLLSGAIIYLRVKWSWRLDIKEVIKTLKGSFGNFCSLALLSIHTQLIVVLTGHFISPRASGMLSVADKMVRGLSALAVPVANIAFPMLSNLFARNLNDAKILRLKVAKILISYSLVCSIFVFFFGSALAKSLFKIDDRHFIEIIRIASFMPVFMSFGVLNGGLTLIPAGFDSEYFLSIVFGEFMALVAFFSSLYFYHEYSGMIAIVVAEGTMAVAFYLFARVRLNSLVARTEI